MDKNKDLTPEIEEVETADVEKNVVSSNNDEPNIMAVLRRKEEEQRQKDAERNKWLKIGGIVLAAIVAIIAIVVSLRSCGSGHTDKPGKIEHEHKYVETVIPPTETEDGYTLYSCEECGESYRDNVVAALEKDNTENTVDSTETSTETETSQNKTTSTEKEATSTPKNNKTDTKKPSISRPNTSTDNKTESKPSTSKPNTSTGNKPVDTMPSKPSNNPSDNTTNNNQDSKPPKDDSSKNETTKDNTSSETTTPPTTSEPEPTTPPTEEETGCNHEHTGNVCRYKQGYNCEHNHKEVKVGSYLHVYCEDIVIAYRDGKTNYYPWSEYY